MEKLNDEQFQNLLAMLKDSVNRTIHNFFSVFVFIQLYKFAKDKDKATMETFVNTMKEEVSLIHKAKVEAIFDLTEKQKESYEKQLFEVMDGCLEPVFKEINKGK